MPLCINTKQKPFFFQLSLETKGSVTVLHFPHLPVDKAIGGKHGPGQAALIEPGEEQLSEPRRRQNSS